MQVVDTPISRSQLKTLANHYFGNLVKAVVDLKQQIIVLDVALHSDAEAYLLQQGSHQTDLWGINLYPELTGSDFIEFDSMINLRPHQNNLTRSVDDVKIQTEIRSLVNKLITT